MKTVITNLAKEVGVNEIMEEARAALVTPPTSPLDLGDFVSPPDEIAVAKYVLMKVRALVELPSDPMPVTRMRAHKIFLAMKRRGELGVQSDVNGGKRVHASSMKLVSQEVFDFYQGFRNLSWKKALKEGFDVVSDKVWTKLFVALFLYQDARAMRS